MGFLSDSTAVVAVVSLRVSLSVAPEVETIGRGPDCLNDADALTLLCQSRCERSSIPCGSGMFRLNAHSEPR